MVTEAQYQAVTALANHRGWKMPADKIIEYARNNPEHEDSRSVLRILWEGDNSGWVEFESSPNGAEEVYEGLPIPQEWGEDPISKMPRDITALSNKEVRKLYSEYNAHFSRANWLLAQALNAKKKAHQKAKRLLQEIISSEVAQGTSQAKAESLAKGNQPYLNLEEEALDAEVSVDRLSALRDIFSKNMEMISRDLTMRQHEWEMERAS